MPQRKQRAQEHRQTAKLVRSVLSCEKHRCCEQISGMEGNLLVHLHVLAVQKPSFSRAMQRGDRQRVAVVAVPRARLLIPSAHKPARWCSPAASWICCCARPTEPLGWA